MRLFKDYQLRIISGISVNFFVAFIFLMFTPTALLILTGDVIAAIVSLAFLIISERELDRRKK